MDAGQWLVIGISAFLLAWFAIWTWVNRQAGREVFAWLKSGAAEVGEITEAWLPNFPGSAGRVVVAHPERSFRQVELFFSLEPRENLLLWLYNRVLKKQDGLLIVRADLKNPPVWEMEAARTGDRSLDSLLARQTKEAFTRLSPRAGFEIALRGRMNAHAERRLNALLQDESKSLLRISLRRTSPHLILHARLTPLRAEPAGVFLNDLVVWLSPPEAAGQ